MEDETVELHIPGETYLLVQDESDHTANTDQLKQTDQSHCSNPSSVVHQSPTIERDPPEDVPNSVDHGNQSSEVMPFISEENGGETPTLLQTDRSRSISLASFRENVYNPTTTRLPNNTSSNSNCCCCCAPSTFCKSLRMKCHTLCKPAMWKYAATPTDQSRPLDRIRYSLLCPPHGVVGRLLFITLTILLAFGLIRTITGEGGVYGGNFFGLIVLFLLCSAAGRLMPLIRLPPLLGMLIMGCILGNVPRINVARYIDVEWSAGLRKVALAVILTRAGLGLDPKALKRMSCVVVRLAFLPCLTEAVVCMVTSHLALQLPWIWGLMLGFVLAAVSPAVVVPSLLALSDEGYGVDQGIPTLVIAAASIDDVLAISSFYVLLGIAFSGSSNIALTVVKGPLEALGGVVYGIVLGVVLWYLPAHRKTKSLDLKRSALLLGGGLFALFGSDVAGIEGAGALGCLTLPFVAGLKWRKQLSEGQMQLGTEAHMSALWSLAQPFLFGLIGAAVDFTKINPPDIGWGILVVFIGLIFRLVASLLAVFGAGFSWKEKFFIPLAWLPKATVQALIGSVALDAANRTGKSLEEKWGLQILTVAVLCILLTAPLGAVAISLSGPRLLKKSSSQPSSDRESGGETGRSPDDIGRSPVEMELMEDVNQSG